MLSTTNIKERWNQSMVLESSQEVAKVKCNTMMGLIMKVIGCKIKGMAQGFISQTLKTDMKVLGLMIRNKVKAKWSFMMGESMKETGALICNMESVS